MHSLRHTNITMQIAAGVPLVTVSGRAGHARTSTTTDIYSHLLKSSDKTAAETLEQLFDSEKRDMKHKGAAVAENFCCRSTFCIEQIAEL